jgi:S-adenosylmethionine hydrolase
MENEVTNTAQKQKEDSMTNKQVIVADVEYSDEYGETWSELTTACVECLNKSGRPWVAYETDPGTDIWSCLCGRTSGVSDLDCMWK